MNDYEKVIEKNGVLSFTPRGKSMWPIIKNKGATVIIVKAPQTLKKYDVAFYRRENTGTPVLHRVMKVNEDSYDMCGDSQIAIEKGVKKSFVFGVMSGYYVGGKYTDCNKNLKYKLTVRIWSCSLFLRRVFLKILRIFGKVAN